MTPEYVVELVQEAIKVIILVSAPPLLLGLTVGVLVSIFQTVTSIQEPTLAFVPKILAVFLAIVIFGSWMLNLLQQFMVNLYSSMPDLLK